MYAATRAIFLVQTQKNKKEPPRKEVTPKKFLYFKKRDFLVSSFFNSPHSQT